MNETDNSRPEPGEDRRLVEILSPLKSLEPPLAAQIANRQAVSAALSALLAANQQRQLPWWRRSISVPVPLAVALAVLLAATLLSSFRNWREPAEPPVVVQGQPATGPAVARKSAAATFQPVAHVRPTWSHYETETYLCGVGRVNSETYYVLKEQNP